MSMLFAPEPSFRAGLAIVGGTTLVTGALTVYDPTMAHFIHFAIAAGFLMVGGVIPLIQGWLYNRPHKVAERAAFDKARWQWYKDQRSKK